MKLILNHHKKSNTVLNKYQLKQQEIFLVSHWKRLNIKISSFSSLSESPTITYVNILKDLQFC